MSQIRKLIEEMNALAEMDMVDDFAVPPVENEPILGATEELETKTKISRALDVLIKAIEDFKNETITDVELIGDNSLLTSIENLDNEVKGMQQNLASMGTAPAPVVVPEEPMMDAEPQEPVDEDNEDSEDDEDDEDDDFIFDDEAELDLFGDEE